MASGAHAEFPVVNVERDWILDEEPMGSKDKFWILRPDDPMPWLFKYSRQNHGLVTGEHWAEKLAAEIADLIALPHATVELAKFEESWGSLSRKFDELADDTVELVHGNELLSGLLPHYDPEKRFGQHRHTLENILNAVQQAVEAEPQALQQEVFRGIGGFVVLDALVLNTDRHHENWALFRRTVDDGAQVRHWLAPSFDHASSLGRELQADRLQSWRSETWRVSWYATRGTGAVFVHEEGQKGENPLRLAEVANRRWPQFVSPWLQRVRELDTDQILSRLGQVPADCMTDDHRAFAGDLIRYTHQRLARAR